MSAVTAEPITRTSRWQKVVGVVGLAVVVWIAVDSPLIDAWFSDGPTEMDHGPGGTGPTDVGPNPGRDAPDTGEGDHAPMDHGSGGVG